MRFAAKVYVSACTYILVLLLALNVSRAGYLQDYSGNTRMSSYDGLWQLTFNYAVLDRFAGQSAPGDTFGTGLMGFDNAMQLGVDSPPFDTASRYLYLYQVLNYGSQGGSAQHLLVLQQTGVTITSFGLWDMTLADNQGDITLSNSFGVDDIPFVPEASANLGVDSPSVSLATTSTLYSGNLTLDSGSDRLVHHLSPGLPVDEATVIFGATSNYPPIFWDSLEGRCSEIAACGFIPKAGFYSTPGDYNNDGIVDGLDFLLWQRGGSPMPLSSGDLIAWEANLADKITTEHLIAIPESSSLLLTTLALTGVSLMRRRSNH